MASEFDRRIGIMLGQEKFNIITAIVSAITPEKCVGAGGAVFVLVWIPVLGLQRPLSGAKTH